MARSLKQLPSKLVRNYRWYVDNLDALRDRSGVSHRVPWKQGALALAKRFF